jgi:hypothetical protein
MPIENFILLVRANCQQRTFFHFTANENVASIREHGLLSMAELRQRRLRHVAGGNALSQELDARTGMDRYVHLCFRKKHGMAHQAIEERRVSELAWFSILPEVVKTPGTMVTLDNAVARDVQAIPISHALAHMDLDVLYTRTDWADAAIQDRLRRAERYELLIPTRIPPAYIQ